jgi:hypothetical protein
LTATEGSPHIATARRRARWLGRLLRAPVVHFVGIGLVAFVAIPGPRPVVVLGAGEVEELRRTWSLSRGRPPTPEQEAALIQMAIDDEILLREAWRRGVSERDPVVAERLERIGRFVSEHDEEPLDPSHAMERARELGLDRGDLVIRRYLTELMRLAIAREADRHLPTEDELEAHLRDNRERFLRPARVRLTHAFVSERRGDAIDVRARELLGELASRPPEAAGDLGDPFPIDREVMATGDELARGFGADFAASIEQLEPGVWSGPVASAYGLHLVWIHERTAESLPSLDEVRSQVVHHFFRTQRAEHLRRRLRELREHYDVRIEGARLSMSSPRAEPHGGHARVRARSALRLGLPG